jgi:hypothetical protein
MMRKINICLISSQTAVAEYACHFDESKYLYRGRGLTRNVNHTILSSNDGDLVS